MVGKFAMTAGILALALLTSTSSVWPKEIIGLASWYGTKFQGKETASGELYDANKLTIACRELPLGSVVKLTNLSNGKTCTARVNDRGPYVKPRKFDCSRATAVKLGFKGKGVQRIKCQTLKIKPQRRMATGK